MAESTIVRVIGIDPSTRATGVVLLAIDTARHGMHAVVEASHEIIGFADNDTLTDRLQRIRDARQELAQFVARLPCIDIMAYENPFHQGGAATSAIFEAIGALISVQAFAYLPAYAIYTATVKKEQALTSAARAPIDTTVRGAKGAKQRALKMAAVEWANNRFTMASPLRPDQDAIADAAAVALAAYHQWAAEQHAREKAEAQGVLKLRRTPARKGA